MKYVLLCIIALSISVGPTRSAEKKSKSPNIGAASAILTDVVTGQIFYSRNAHVRRPMASTTKIMTAVIVIENCDLDDIVTASERAAQTPFTSLNLKPGEQVRVKDLLYAMLIRSANDAAVALAEHVGGTVEGFAQMMNDKAVLIGAKNTHFVTPNGLYAPGHYSTAYDLALITRYALRIPVFNDIIAAKSKKIERSVNQKDLVVQSSSRFMKYYIGADGVKSGYIKQAGYCYVGSATRGGWRLVSVVLKSPDSQADTKALMDYGFGNYRRIVLGSPDRPVAKVPIAGGSSRLDVVPSERIHVAVKTGNADKARTEIKLDEHIYAPVRKGAKVGSITAYVGGKPVATVDLEAASDVEESVVSTVWPWARAIGLLSMISIGVASGRTAAKSSVGGRRRVS